MNIRLFPEQFLRRDACFGLFKLDDAGELDLPITIEGDIGIPFHIVHSEPDHLAYLTGLILLQAWTTGITEFGISPTERRPLLVVTDRPGRFTEAYLQLHLPLEKVRAISMRRRVLLFQKSGSPGSPSTDKAGYWDLFLRSGDERTRLHNFFPAYQILSATGTPRPVASRQHLGHRDEAGPAVLITRKSDKDTLRLLHERYRPLLAIFDAHGVAVSDPDSGTPAIFYHESIFAPELPRLDPDQVVLCCLPDARFQHFSSRADLCLIEPPEPNNLTRIWKDVDGALQALIERMNWLQVLPFF